MRSSMEVSQPNLNQNPSHNINQNPPESLQDDFFVFLENEKKAPTSSSFFSENSLSQDILTVTDAEPDIPLEVFYALYHTLWPQIENISDVSFKDAWTQFIGGSLIKGCLCPPEKLITEKRVKDIKNKLSQKGGENQVFQDLDQLVNSISDLKQKITNYSGQIFQKEEILTSLSSVQGFYLRFRTRVKTEVQAILEKEQINASSVSEYDALDDLLEPKAIMMSDVFPHHWAYRISRNQARKLLSIDTFSRSIKSASGSPSNHRVIALPENTDEPLVFFKANGNPPIQPEKEFMLYSLYRNLQIPVPETALLILTDVFEANPDYFYAVQASEAVLGEAPVKAYRDPETVFDPEAYVSQFIGALLTNPSDGSFKNFQYSPKYKTFISIDNDLVFKPELSGKDDDDKVVNVKSILYLVPQIDQPLPEPSKAFFMTLDPHLTTLSWLQDLSQKNREYQGLFTRLTFQNARCLYQNLLPQGETPSLAACLEQKVNVDAELHPGESFYPRILVSQNLLTTLTEKLQKVEKILLHNRSANLQTLFEEVSPILGKYYNKLRLEFHDPEEAMEALWEYKKSNIDYSYLSSLFSNEELNNLPNTQTVSDENLIPDTFLEEYKNTLISGRSPLDNFIRRHNHRRKKGVLNLKGALRELRLLIQQNLIDSQSIRDIVNFCHNISKMETTDRDQNLIQEIISIFSNLPHPELKWLLTLEKYFRQADHDVPKDLIPFSPKVNGAFMKQRTFVLTESERQYLFDPQGNIQKNTSLTGRSSVTCFPTNKDPEFYLKQYPEFPGYEFASSLFMRLLGIQHLPYHDLLIINSNSNQPHSYPVLLTQRILGQPVLRVWNDPQAFSNLDPLHTGLLIISAMLLNPEDGKEDNFILSPNGRYLIPIDNDHCFLPSTFQKEGNFWNAFTVNTALQTKTLLFCLDEMCVPLHPEVRKHILSIDFDLLFTVWMTELIKVEEKCNNLVDQDQRTTFIEHGTVMRIPFYRQFVENLHWKVHKIQDILKNTLRATPFDLLKAIEPFAARCYQDSFKQGNSLQGRFKAATHQLYTKINSNGSRVSILNTQTMIEIINISKQDLQKDVAFQRMGPLDVLELLNQLIQERRQRTKAEQELLYELDEKKEEDIWVALFGNPPVELALRAFLTNPKEGLVLKRSKLVTKSKLRELFSEAPNQGMKIRFLSIPESPLLTSKEMRILAEECPHLEYLNVSGSPKLQEIILKKEEWPMLTRLEAKECQSLENFVSYSPLKILRIGTASKIRIFVEKPSLDLLTISTKANIFELSIKKGKGFEVKFLGKTLSNDDFLLSAIREKEDIERYFRDWKIMIGGANSINSSRDLAPFATCMNFSAANIQTEDIKKMVTSLNLVNLDRLELHENEFFGASSLEYLVQGNWPKLSYLDLSFTEIDDAAIKVLTQGNWPLLETLYLQSAKITSIGVEAIANQTKWPQLKSLNLSYNDITDEGIRILSQGNWLQLEILHLEGIKITSTGVEAIIDKWPKLKLLNLSSNNIKDECFKILSRGNWPLLETLNLDNIDVSKKALIHFLVNSHWPNFKKITLPKYFDENDLRLAYNFIQKDLSQVEDLELNNLQIAEAQIDLIINKNQNRFPRLKYLNLSDNDLSTIVGTISLMDCPLLEQLHLENTKLTLKRFESIVNQSKWLHHLKHLNLSNNEITDDGISLFALAEWPLLQELNLKNTKITQQGINSLVGKINLPHLRKIDISENDIFDEGLETLVLGDWPLLEHLVFSKTQVTSKGTITLLENFKWPNLHQLRQSLYESPFDYNLPELILAMVPMDYNKRRSIMVVVLNMAWLNSKEIYLSIEESESLLLLPQDRLDQLESIELSFNAFSSNIIEFVIWPSNLKILDLSNTSLSQEKQLERLFTNKCPSLEDLCLRGTNITTEGIQVLTQKSDWPNLKKLDVSHNSIPNEGIQPLAMANWPLLEHLNLEDTKITVQGIELLISQSNWPRLKELNISWNPIRNEGLEILVSAKWPQLELLNLSLTKITAQGIESIINKSDWPSLKKLDVSWNSIQNEGLEILSNGKWPQLESISLQSTDLAEKGIASMTRRSEWPNLKFIDLSYNRNLFDEGLKALASGKWPLLERLSLKKVLITPQDVETLLNKSIWPNLKEIHLTDCGLGGQSDSIKTLVSTKWPSVEFTLIPFDFQRSISQSNGPQRKISNDDEDLMEQEA